MCCHSPRVWRQDLTSPRFQRVREVVVSARRTNPAFEPERAPKFLPQRERQRHPMHARSLPEIARSLADTLANSNPLIETAHQGGRRDGEALAEAATCQQVRHNIERALQGRREGLSEVLVEALVEVCDDLPGKLILILDQAEEVLTLTPSGRPGDDAAAAFFRFIEDVYLRNVDMRLVVALRTEYYGRFRDELRISDDRLGKRPRSGGVQPYLLRPLRAKSALLETIHAPTLA